MSLIFNPTISGSRNWISLCNDSTGQYIAALNQQTGTYGIYISTNGGNTWTTPTNGINLQTSSDLCVSICCSRDFKNIAVLRTSGDIYISTNYGVLWTRTASPIAPSYYDDYLGYDICGSSDLSTIYAIVYQPAADNSNKLLVSTNFGSTWSVKSFSLYDGAEYHVAQSVCCSSDGTKLGIGGNYYGYMRITQDYGNTYTDSSYVSGNIIRCNDSFTYFIASFDDPFLSAVYLYNLSGSYYSSNLSTYYYYFKNRVACSYDFSKIAYCEYDGTNMKLYYSTDFGQSFTFFNNYDFGIINFHNNGIICVSRSNNSSNTLQGTIWTGANSQTPETFPPITLKISSTLLSTNNWTASCCSDDFSKVYIASNTLSVTGLFYSTDYGNSFTQYTATGALTNQTTGKTWNSLCCSSDGSKIAGTRGTDNIYYYNGTTWSVIYTNSTLTFSAITGNYDLSKLVVVESTGNIYIYNNSIWTPTSVTTAGSMLSVCCDYNMNNIAAVSTTINGNIYISNNSGTSWSIIKQGNWSDIYCTKDFTKLVACQQGTAGNIFVSYDSGITWGQTEAPPKSWASISANGSMKKIIAAAGRTGTDQLVYYSQDYGMSWQTSGQIKSWTTVAFDQTSNFIIASGVYGSTIAYVGDLNGPKYTYKNIDIDTIFQSTTQDSSSNIGTYSLANFKFNLSPFFVSKYLKPFNTGTTNSSSIYGYAKNIGYLINGVDIATYCCPKYTIVTGNYAPSGTGAFAVPPANNVNNQSVPANATGMLVVMIGGGGGGGGGGSRTGGGATGGSGGGGGGLFAVYIPISSSTYSMSIGGSGRYGGTNSNDEADLLPGQLDTDNPNNPGGSGLAGGDTTFTYNSNTYTCKGGSGGNGGPEGTGTTAGVAGGTVGSVSGTSPYTIVVNVAGNNSPNVTNVGEPTPGGRGGLSGNFADNSYTSTNTLINNTLINLLSPQVSRESNNIPTTQKLYYGEGGNGGKGDHGSNWGYCGEYGAPGCVIIFWYY